MIKKSWWAAVLLFDLVIAAQTFADADAVRPQLHTNEAFVEDVTRSTTLPNSDVIATFAFVLGNLPDTVKVYPTENYYYFFFYHNSIRYSGNIRLDASDRDDGKLYFAYYEDFAEWAEQTPAKYQTFDKSDGVTVEKLESLVYRISYGGKSVVFKLNDLSGVKPPATLLGPDESYIGPIFDESAIRFFLIFNRRLKLFHYVLDETITVPDHFVAAKRTNHIVIGRRTGFAFYEDYRLKRKILIGVFEANVLVNNYYDGPFDQLPDNFIEGDALRQAIVEVEPTLAGKINRFGRGPDGNRYLIAPYIYYRAEDDLERVDKCATSRRRGDDTYYNCFVHKEEESDIAPIQPKVARKIYRRLKYQNKHRR
jgi:hypothetical protein